MVRTCNLTFLLLNIIQIPALVLVITSKLLNFLSFRSKQGNQLHKEKAEALLAAKEELEEGETKNADRAMEKESNHKI